MRSDRKVGRSQKKRQKSDKQTGNASLYPLDPKAAIRAIMEAGPHPKDEKSANRRAKKQKKD